MALLETVTYETLVIEGEVSEGGTLITGQNLTMGAVLGRIAASGKLNLSDEGVSDGSEVPFAILLEDCDATSADKGCPILLAGVVNEGALNFGGTNDADAVRDVLRSGGIYLKTVMGA